ncbi:MAG: hypothetical protein M3Q07_26825 [Pseudobdellovibrionaceae bacterium]|nr:hypothetical protein [Pseudobdellovibrionaceae bacterium]
MPSPQQTFAPQPPMMSADGQPVFVPGQPLPAPGMPQPNVFAEAAQYGQNISHQQPHSQSPVSEQPAYVHAQAPAAPMQAFAAQASASAPAIQTLAPQASAPAMPAFEPAAEPMMEQPVTASRQMQNQAMKKQPRTQDIDDEPEMTEEARLSEILPKAGTIEKSKPKRKGLFWRKKTDDDDDQSDDGDDKGSWKSATGKKGKEKEEDEDLENGEDWTVASNKKSAPDPVADKDDDEPAESEAWAPEATKRSEPKRDSLLNETQGPQHLVRRTPQGPVTKERNASVTEDGWNLNDQVASDHDEEDEEEVG